MNNGYTRRLIEPLCRAAVDRGKIVVLIGARQTGKSTLAEALFAEVPDRDKLALNLDDPFLRDRLIAEESSLERAIEEQAQRPWADISRFHLLIDEAQKAPGLFERIKALHDREGERLQIVLTGSSALQIHDPVAESLAGRARILHLHPFALSEGFAHVQGSDPVADELAEVMGRLLSGRFGVRDFEALIERARRQAAKRQQYCARHMRFPLFPEPSGDEEPELWIRDYLATYIEKDVQSLSAVGKVALFRAALAQLAARVGSTIKWETVAQEIGTTSPTLRSYVGLMEQTFNLLRLGAFTLNPVKRVVRAPKLYLADAGLMWGLRGFEDRHILETTGMLGVYAEATAIAELAKWCSLEPTAPELRFWHKTRVSEVDLVISNRGYHIPFEVKLGRSVDRRWLRGLDAFDADHRHLVEIPYRLILHMGEPEVLDERTYALPLWMLV